MTKIFAHRGSKGTHPENTLSAFREAVRVGSDGIELDVQLSKDGQLVVIHDETINRTTDGTGTVGDMTVKELQEYDAGSWFSMEYATEKIPTFTEVLDLLTEIGFTGTLNIELKTDQYDYPGIEQKLVKLIQKQQPVFEVIYSSFNPLTLERLGEIDPQTKKAWIMVGDKFTILFSKYLLLIDSIHPSFTWFSKMEKELIDYPKYIRPWTVNEESAMILCFKRNVDAFHTDYPAQAIQCRNKLADN
ncbi:glycerophosphodiester phosphodiesterase [Periweissella fabaria]|uniref:Glycerophosphodiester phosphodiesterase n=1 Tax=Periweissella fabaria TaxID=546157 RepID=A0ABN8BKW8_9LACO|nr:glycerophosphodiester phosphodiesterase [Periweissella fabaria]MCM0596833.1 glycerophosphodiester phosphodiesterase [Periweissella fabaria]CAH0416570.1 Glycerophosphodiester phosphodiesterase [Periweissella fabaria]